MTTFSTAVIADEAAVPVIDISAARNGASAAAVAEVAAAIGGAGRSLGFLQVVGHGIDPRLFHRVYDAADQLWALPNVVLDQWASPTGHPFRGVWYGLDDRGARVWQRLQNTRIDTPEQAKAEGYGDDVADFFGGNVHPNVPGLAAAVDACFAAGREVGSLLMGLVAVDLGLDRDYFTPYFDKDVSYFAVQDYPAMPHTAPGGLRLGEHSDSGALTMLHQRGEYDGLQLRRTTGEIVTIPIIDDALVVNVGDLMARWTNDAWLATPHRVIDGRPGQARTSIAMHYLPNVDAVIAPLPGCTTSDGPAYEPVSMYEWNSRYFQKKSRVLRLADEAGD
jgi:isopenicillin N synthase-like dioxygenase